MPNGLPGDPTPPGKAQDEKLKMDKRDLTSISMSSSTSSTMIGFSAAIITLILTLVEKSEDIFHIEIVISMYIITTILSFIAIEFYTLSTWDDPNYFRWGTIGSVFYGSAKVFMVIGIGLTCLVVGKFFILALFALALFSLGELVYYRLRFKYKNDDPMMSYRKTARFAMLLEMIFGFFLLFAIKFLWI